MKRLPIYVALAAGLGVLAVWVPVLLDPPAGGYESWMRAAVEHPSVWVFQGLFVAGFVLGLFGKVGWMDLPLLAIATVALFPLAAGLAIAGGDASVDWPREFYLYAAWLIPVLFGLLTGKVIGRMQQRAAETKTASRRNRKRRKKR